MFFVCLFVFCFFFGVGGGGGGVDKIKYPTRTEHRFVLVICTRIKIKGEVSIGYLPSRPVFRVGHLYFEGVSSIAVLYL